ncbi:MAG: DNA-directed RNA polymerase subunit K [Nanoarchaeota archaeon]
MNTESLTKYERARILGARALQIAMNAPLLIKLSKEELEKTNFDPLNIAEIELKSGVLPMNIKKPMPEKKEEKLKRKKTRDMSDEEKMRLEKEEEEEVKASGEIMELSKSDEETENLSEDSLGEEELARKEIE